jgi:hypothetical protein
VFIRYNETLDFWEYDTSAGQTGAGPWLILPVNTKSLFSEWINVPYLASNFTGSGSMVWTVESADQVTYSYTLIGKTLLVVLQINGTSVSGTVGTYLQVRLPSGFLPSRSMEGHIIAQDNGITIHCRVRIFASDPLLYVARADFVNWVANANNTSIFGQLFLLIQ